MLRARDINVLPSLPCGETRKLQNAVREKTQRVVISGVPIDIDEDSIKENTGAVEVRRIFKRGASTNEKTPTTTVTLSYSCSTEEVPLRVQIGYLSFKTRTYIPQVTRCYKCQKFGHIAARCRKETDTCPVCAGPHKYTDCTNKDNKKCANCGEPHSASYKECPKFLASKTLVKHAAVNRLSYRDALIQIRKQERTTQNRSVTTPPDQAQTIDTSTTKQSRSTVNKDIQCNMDTDSSAVVDVGGASADHGPRYYLHQQNQQQGRQ